MKATGRGAGAGPRSATPHGDGDGAARPALRAEGRDRTARAHACTEHGPPAQAAGSPSSDLSRSHAPPPGSELGGRAPWRAERARPVCSAGAGARTPRARKSTVHTALHSFPGSDGDGWYCITPRPCLVSKNFTK